MAFKSLLKKIKYGRPIVIVSGLPRSGTSMLMKMLEAGGMEIVSDGVRTADDDNPKGYYELERVKKLDKDSDKSWLKPMRGKAVKIVSYFLKYLPESNHYKVVFIERNLEEVIVSQNKMLVNRGKPLDPDGGKGMIRNFESHLWKIKHVVLDKPWFEVLYINHRDILSDPKVAAKKIYRFLDEKLDEAKMAAAVDPKLYRNRQ
jgi:hypothetical protein